MLVFKRKSRSFSLIYVPNLAISIIWENGKDGQRSNLAPHRVWRLLNNSFSLLLPNTDFLIISYITLLFSGRGFLRSAERACYILFLSFPITNEEPHFGQFTFRDIGLLGTRSFWPHESQGMILFSLSFCVGTVLDFDENNALQTVLGNKWSWK